MIRKRYFIVLLVFVLQGCLPTTIETPIDSNRKDKCKHLKPPPDFFKSMGFEAGAAISTIKDVAKGNTNIKTNPKVWSLISKTTADDRVMSYLRCMAQEFEGYTKEEARYFYTMQQFMKTSPTADEFIKWQKLNPWPKKSKTRSQKKPLKISKFLEVEKKLIRKHELRPDGKTQSNLLEYFKAEEKNKPFFTYIEELKRKYLASEKHKGVTHVVAKAGAGKSFIAKHLGLKNSKYISLKKISLTKEFSTLWLSEEPDLSIFISNTRKKHLNKLKKLNIEKFSLKSLLKKGESIPAFLIIDDLDEIHPDSTTLLLERIEKETFKSKNDFIEVIIFGRPEALTDFYIDPHYERNKDRNFFELFSPIFIYHNDIKFRVNAYNEYKKYSGKNKLITKDLINLIQKFPFLVYSMQNLAIGNFILEKSKYFKSKDENEVKESLFSNLLERNAKTHNRPMLDNSELCRIYIDLLTCIAANYIDKIDLEGFFVVDSTDTIEIEIENGKTLGVAKAFNVLDRSGLAYLSPAKFSDRRYRFEPLWLHYFLARKKNEAPYYVTN